MKLNLVKKYAIRILIVVLTLIFCWLILRAVSLRQVDDVSPNIPCTQDILDKSETLMVIPIFENRSIAENKSWCDFILSLNKTLGMHGVYHKYLEFSELRDESYIFIGMEEFRKCFGKYPEIFEAPQLALSSENEKLLRKMGFEVRGYPYQMTHKVYHCSDTGKYSNRFVDWF